MVDGKHIMAEKRVNLVSVLDAVRVQVDEWFLGGAKHVMSFSRSTAQYSDAVSLLT